MIQQKEKEEMWRRVSKEIGMNIFLEIINNPEHEEYEEMLEWLGGKFDPEHFDLIEVGFDDPDKRRKFAFG